ncbi:MAG: GNAT family N-acetyltransferase [Actinobacteria bacterium]|nr:GNAT family N-acetyltransferase [Actinomycetota bacterium]
MGGADDLARTIAFSRRLFERISTRVEPSRFGRAFFHEGFPERYDSNFLLVERPVGAATAEQVASEADRLLSGLPHREIVVEDDGEGGRLALSLAEIGYRTDRLVVMVDRRDPDRVPTVRVQELSFEQVRPLHTEVLRRDPTTAGVADALAGFREVLVREAGARFFAARDEDVGRFASCCELYVQDGVAQVEDVNTLEELRGRGLARACVLRAVDEARRAGADLVFLHADASDWPQELYAKLGFDPIGHIWSFVRVPE